MGRINDTVNRFKLWNPEARRDPHAVYAQIRQEEPVYRAIGPVSGNTFWFMTRYEDAIAALKEARFIKDFRKVAAPDELARYEADPSSALDRHMLNLDPPDHTRLRNLVHKAFTPKMVASLEPRIQQIAESLLDALPTPGAADLIAAYAFPLPVIVIAELLGIPPEERDQFRVWSKTILFESDQQKRMGAAMEAVQYFMRIFELRRADPHEDLISALVAAEESGDRLNSQELLGMVFLLLVAGHETTVNLIGNGTLTLLQHPDQLALLRENPALIGSAVEEMLRYHGPVENTITRWAEVDIDWRGCLIERGDMVVATLLSANRDPEQFPDPNVFDITRDPNRHIAFGHGIHYCVGAPLARLEGTIAINTLLRRLPVIALAAPQEELEWADNILLRGLKTFPVRF